MTSGSASRSGISREAAYLRGVMPNSSPPAHEELKLPLGVEVVLASGSPYRARLLEDLGLSVTIDVPGIDERSADGLLAEEGPAHLAVELARRKAEAVAPRHPGAWIIAADQVGVLRSGRGSVMLTKRPSPEEAVSQLLAMRGSTHLLVNGVAVVQAPWGPGVTGVDVQRVTMRDFTAQEARSYVERFSPLDTVGSYRIEDQEMMSQEERLVSGVAGEDPSGVIGMPVPLLRRLFAELAHRVLTDL